MFKFIYTPIIGIFITTNLMAITCYDYTVSNASNQYEPIKQKINGLAVGKQICVPSGFQKKLDDTHVCKIVPKLITVKLTETNPENNNKCINLYIDVKNAESQEVIIKMLFNDDTFLQNSGLKTTGILSFQRNYNLYQGDIINKKNLLIAEKNQKIEDIVNAHNNNNLSSEEEKSKSNFLNSFKELESWNPKNYLKDMDYLKDTATIKTKSSVSEANVEFKECSENIQKIPSFSLDDMLDGIKDSIFDLEGQVADTATNIMTNIQDSLLEMTSDEAMMSYTIQGISNVTAYAICSFRSFSKIGDAKQVVSTASSVVAASGATAEAATPQEAVTATTSSETSCWISIPFGSGACAVYAPAGFKVGGQSLTGTSNAEDFQAAKMKKDSVEGATFDSCMQTEPDNIMRYILKLVNLSANGGKIEFDTLKECNDKEIQDKYKNKNAFDKAGNPTRNKVSDFLNSGVDFLQKNRDDMLKMIEDSVENTKNENAVENNPKNLDNLMITLKENFNSKNFSEIYPTLNFELFDNYINSYKNFKPFITQNNYSTNIEIGLDILISPYLNAQNNNKLSTNYIEIINGSNNFLYRYISSLPAYDFYMNFFIGMDVTGLNTVGGVDFVAQSASSYNANPKTLLQLLGTQGAEAFVNDTNAKAKEIRDIMIENMEDYNNIWSNVLKYFSKDFSFSYTIVNGKMIYIINVNDIKHIMEVELNKIAKKPRYLGQKDSNGKEIEGFNINYIKSRLSQLDSRITMLLSSSNPKDKELVSKYISSYVQFLLDYNLYLATYDISNQFSLLHIIDDTNIKLQSSFSQLKGYEVEIVQDMFRKFLSFSNIK